MSRTILLLEDEESLRRGVSFKLEKEGYIVLSAATVNEGKLMFAENDIKLVVCDITLPDGSGLDFCRYIRHDLKSDVRFMFLTALDQEIDMVMGYEAGADDYVTKPFSLAVFMSKVQVVFNRLDKSVTLVNGENELSADVVKSGELSFYPKDMRLFVGQKKVELTKNECKILQLFLNNPKQILSKNQILEHIFDMEENYVDDNTVAVNICRLRDKIMDNDRTDKYIKNVRGMGYIWSRTVD